MQPSQGASLWTSLLNTCCNRESLTVPGASPPLEHTDRFEVIGLGKHVDHAGR